MASILRVSDRPCWPGFLIGALEFLAAGARLQEFAEGRFGAEFVAEVALVQAPDGALRAIELVRPSGTPRFDTWVTSVAKARLEAFRFDGGLARAPLRSVWRFTGRLSFSKKTAPVLRDVAAALPLLALGFLSGGRLPFGLGRFDEAAGTAEVVDLSSPHFECRVRAVETEE
ncbi:MAG: hypothetical protein INH41_26265 [Myxococcaceae bacterium]|nr:hypothetical protein [Myxococcaceae bacterium]MCA3015904.1 hypothetical protein [Myxococcaceae bacterium]